MIARTAAISLSLACLPTFSLLAAQKRVEANSTELAFLKELDKSWSSGEASKVLAHFDFIHAGLRNALVRRIDASMRRVTRSSKILDCFEIERSDGQKQRAFFLSTELQPVATPQRERVLFEVLVLRPHADASAHKPRAMLLMPTTRRAQEHVLGKTGNKLKGLPIGRALTGGCPACNWSVRTPTTGNWAVVLRDPTYSGCAENVEIYNLDVDLMMGVRIEPDTIPGLNVNLDAYVGRCQSMLAQVFGVPNVEGENTKLSEAAKREVLAGVPAFRRDLTVGERSWRLYALRSGPMTYLLNLQGPRALLASGDMKVDDLLKSFHLLEDGRKLHLQKIIRMHARGKLRADGVFHSKALGIAIRAPFADWAHSQPMGAFEMQSYWARKGKGRFTLFCMNSAQRRIDEGQAKRYLLAWLAREQRAGTFCSIEAEQVVRRRLGGIRGGWVEFSCGSRCGTEGLCSKAFAAAVPHGSRLVLVHGCAEPGPEQDAIYEKLIEAAQTLELR